MAKIQFPGLSRRNFLGIFSLLPFTVDSTVAQNIPGIAKVAKFVRPRDRWDADAFFEFLMALPPNAMLELQISQEILPKDATLKDLGSNIESARRMQKHFLKVSSGFFGWIFNDETKLNYHEVVVGVAEKMEVHKAIIAASSTLDLERELHVKLFAELWDKLTPDQREKLLRDVDKTKSIKDKTAIAAMSSGAALAVLSGTVIFTGFAFYTTMSVAIAGAAAAIGVALPFAVFSSASALIAFLAGPVGWIIGGVSALGGLLLLGRKDISKTAAFIAHIHALKIDALRAAKVPQSKIFRK